MTDQLLQTYFLNKATPAEARQVLAWFDTDEGKYYLTTRLDTQLARPNWSSPPNTPPPDTERMLAALRQKMASRPLPVVRPNLWWTQPMRWAAVFIGALLLTAGGYAGYRSIYPDDLTQQTAFGQTRQLRLPDGSAVTLNGNSRLRYAPRWASGQTREVWLDGEGFFHVTHQQQHERFMVHLPNKLTIEVLGTQFDVVARESHVKVVLNNGKIQLDMGKQNTQKLTMKPGDLVYADVKTKEYYRKRVDASAQSAWRTGQLALNATSLDEVATMLEDTYGVTVVITDPDLRRQTISGSIPNQSMQTILNGLSALFDLRITKNENQIIINRNN